MKTPKILAAAIIVGAALAACATTAPGAKPDDMSARMHHETAERLDAKAGEHEAQYDPKAEATRTKTRTAGGARSEADFITYEQTYNPTAEHLAKAEELHDHASQHRQAAAALEAFEEDQCGDFSKKVRASCPLLGVVKRVDSIDGGVRLLLAEKINPEVAVAHMQCHYAFGRKKGHEGMPACPLYLKDLTIVVSGDHTVDITATDPAVTEQIRTRAASHVHH